MLLQVLWCCLSGSPLGAAQACVQGAGSSSSSTGSTGISSKSGTGSSSWQLGRCQGSPAAVGPLVCKSESTACVVLHGRCLFLILDCGGVQQLFFQS
jgi:hypothetical protein